MEVASWHLYRLLQERTPEVNISHRRMPTWEQHCQYVQRHLDGKVLYDDDGEIVFEPHQHWYLVHAVPGGVIGQVYLTLRREIGVQIYWNKQKRGYGGAAVDALLEVTGPGEYLANVNPKNAASAKLWRSRGFSLIQHTYRGTIKPS